MVSANAYPVMGGVETHIYEVAPRLRQAGFAVSVLTTDRTGTLPTHDQINGVSIMRVPSWPRDRDYYLAPGVARTIQRGNWNLVHCQGYHTFVPPLAMLASLRAGIPYVLTFHSGGHGSRLRTQLRSIQDLAMRPLLARARRLIAVSDFEADSFSRRLRLPPTRFMTIPNGTEMVLPAGVSLESDDPSLILSVGRLERYKGHHRVIGALPHVIKLIPEARLRIVGAGPYESELVRFAREHGVADRVEIGSIPPTDRAGMATLLARAALVVLLSEYEAHPVAVAEALALRRRVLVADTSGLSELAKRNLARAIPLNSSPEETAQAVVEQLRSPAPPQFDLPTWDECAGELGQIYRSVLAR
jgi:glycosyltransferase involved in cell wall biosynthesis